MKKKTSSKAIKASEGEAMRPEYDFSAGIRGKHYKSRLDGYTIRIHKQDGTTQVKRKGSVVLEPDVQKYFPDSQAVNRALRTLITLFPQGRKASASGARPDRSQQKAELSSEQ